ncbi:outer membrane beta-barrel protein [Cytophaga aurantiaca]|uniref:outer membrane beta-barrel protein n=1 Tax=Cytophaga aurantiaca TaxID=29530 RepID=UPI000382A222|nr:outer membrane beta-barrel protein [Cytophaga aurantiaca]
MNYKLHLFLSSVFLLFSISIHAQQKPTPKPKEFSVFKIGFCYMPQTTFISNSGEKNDPDANPMWKKGFMTGLTGGNVFNEKISLDFGVLYSKQGVDYGSNSPFYAPITLSYLKIPITLNYRPFIKHKVPIEFTAGFQYSNLKKAIIDMPSGYYLPGSDMQWFNKSLFDVVAGVGFNFRLADKVFMNTKFRADYSLADPINKDYIYNAHGSTGSHWKSDRSSSRNITLGLSIGLEYHFEK